MPSKETIQDAFYGASTKRAYKAYQTQFEGYVQLHCKGLDPRQASPKICTDFFHFLAEDKDKKARTIDQAKSALVAYFTFHGVNPNPAQSIEARRYVVALQKYNKQNNIDEEKKAHPLSVHELSTLLNCLSNQPPFLGAMLRLLFCGCFMDCFRISEMLNLRWNDVTLVEDDKGKYLSVRLKWHKKAKVVEECQIYHLVDETAFPCLRVCAFYEEYISLIRVSCVNINKDAFVFPAFNLHNQITPVVDWYTCLDQKHLRRILQDMVQNCPNLAICITLHSMRRGGAFYRVFESPQRRFNFRELMAWCRWGDEKTCCEYLITRSISNEIDPRNLLRAQHPNLFHPLNTHITNLTNTDNIARLLVNMLVEKNLMKEVPPNPPQKQRQAAMGEFLVQKAIPTARCGREAWQQWFFTDPKQGHYCALKDYTSDMIREDRKKYSERLTFSLAFNRYKSYEQLESPYAGFTGSYLKLLREIRRRKRENKL